MECSGVLFVPFSFSATFLTSYWQLFENAKSQVSTFAH